MPGPPPPYGDRGAPRDLAAPPQLLAPPPLPTPRHAACTVAPRAPRRRSPKLADFGPRLVRPDALVMSRKCHGLALKGPGRYHLARSQVAKDLPQHCQHVMPRELRSGPNLVTSHKNLTRFGLDAARFRTNMVERGPRLVKLSQT